MRPAPTVRRRVSLGCLDPTLEAVQEHGMHMMPVDGIAGSKRGLTQLEVHLQAEARHSIWCRPGWGGGGRCPPCSLTALMMMNRPSALWALPP